MIDLEVICHDLAGLFFDSSLPFIVNICLSALVVILVSVDITISCSGRPCILIL